MNGVEVLTAQLTVVHRMVSGLIAQIDAEAWTTRPAPGQNLSGYSAWHMVATQDWVVHMVLQGAPEVRVQGAWAEHPGINPPLPPFGCTLEEADAVAHLAPQAEVLAYEADVFARIEAWLATLNDADLDRVPDVLARARDYPAERVTPAYLHELADQVEWNVARFLTSPCIGHLRGHCGELELQLELLHAAHG